MAIEYYIRETALGKELVSHKHFMWFILARGRDDLWVIVEQQLVPSNLMKRKSLKPITEPQAKLILFSSK